MFTYRLILEDGKPADPPTFVTAVPSWKVGETLLIRPGFVFEILAVDETSEPQTWTVRRRARS